MDLADFRLVVDVHLMGSVNCTKAVWDHMRAQNYGRIVMTTSSSGLYGNFGQSNYGAAKMALVGLMQTLALEGARHNIRVNCIAPTAATQMLEGLLPQKELDLLHPGRVSPGVLVLVGEDAPTRCILVRRRRLLRGGPCDADARDVRGRRARRRRRRSSRPGRRSSTGMESSFRRPVNGRDASNCRMPGIRGLQRAKTEIRVDRARRAQSMIGPIAAWRQSAADRPLR